MDTSQGQYATYNNMYGNLKDHLICAYWICGRGYQLPLISIILILRIFRHRVNRRQCLLATKLVVQLQLKVLYMEVVSEEPAASYSSPAQCQKWTAVRHYTHAAEAPTTINFLSGSLVFFDG